MARQRKGRLVDGILLLDKPQGLSSNQALQRVKRLYGAQKAGHTGSLDPMAAGVLPICLGEATKFSQYLLNADKAYTATIKFGELTSTGDAEGELLAASDAGYITRDGLLAVMSLFRGDIQQVPPMYSALKMNGQPLYKLAREGMEVERQPRLVTIYGFELLAFREGKNPEADIHISCSKGTYIRSIAVDVGAALGVGAHLSRLRRVKAGTFDEKDCITIGSLEALQAQNGVIEMDNLLISPEQAVNHLPLVEVSDAAGYYVRLGQAVRVTRAPTAGLVRIREENGIFLGVGEILDDGRVTPRRLMVGN